MQQKQFVFHLEGAQYNTLLVRCVEDYHELKSALVDVMALVHCKFPPLLKGVRDIVRHRAEAARQKIQREQERKMGGGGGDTRSRSVEKRRSRERSGGRGSKSRDGGGGRKRSREEEPERKRSGEKRSRDGACAQDRSGGATAFHSYPTLLLSHIPHSLSPLLSLSLSTIGVLLQVQVAAAARGASDTAVVAAIAIEADGVAVGAAIEIVAAVIAIETAIATAAAVVGGGERCDVRRRAVWTYIIWGVLDVSLVNFKHIHTQTEAAECSWRPLALPFYFRNRDRRRQLPSSDLHAPRARSSRQRCPRSACPPRARRP